MYKKILSTLAVAVAFSFFIFPHLTSGASYNISSKAPKNFIIGVWAQSTTNSEHKDNFGYWKSLGINTLIGHDNGPQKNVTPKQWDAVAISAGLKFVRLPSDDAAYDKQQFQAGNLIALMIGDENDRIAPNTTGYNDSTLNTAVLNPAKAIRAIDPNIPVFMNMLGAALSGNVNKPWYTRAIQEGTDFYSYDWYPINTGYYIKQNLVDRFQNAVDWSGRPPLMYIEVSDQHLNRFPGQNNPAYAARNSRKRGPLPFEIRGEMAVSVAEGAPGLIFFADSFYPFQFDGMTVQARQVVQQENAVWTKLTADPGTRISNLPSGLIGSRRLYNGSYKNIIANYTYDTIKVGTYTFGPLDYKILNDGEIPTGTVTVTAGHEPTPAEVGDVSPADNTDGSAAAKPTGGTMNSGSTGSTGGTTNGGTTSGGTTTGGSTGGSNSGGSTSGNSNGGTTTQPPAQTLTASCAPSKASVKVNTYTSWVATISNGKYPLKYQWTGSDDKQSTYNRPSARYTTAGTKQMSLTVISKDGQTKTVQCSPLEITLDPLLASCDVSVTKVNATSMRVRWTAYAKGGDRTYTYSWNGTDGISGTSRTMSQVFTTGGTKQATIVITSGTQSKTLTCGATLPTTLSAIQVYGSCSSSVNGNKINWRANGSNGWPYEYSISANGTTDTASWLSTEYSGGGDKTGLVTITSKGTTIFLQCAGSVIGQ